MSESVLEPPDAQNRPLREADHTVGEVLFGKFKISDLVQHNDSASIYAARDLSNNTLVLIETIDTRIPSGFNSFARLAKGLLQLDHENILRLIAYEEVASRPYFVWEFVDFVRLEDLVENGGFIEQESEIFDTISQICRGLQFAHEKGIAHGYLHPRNICLADRDGEICIKIANFGFSHLQQQLRQFEQSGVILHASPEADVFQLAVLSYFTATGESPDPSKTLDGVLNPRNRDKVSFDALTDQRSDMRGCEEFAQLLDDTMDAEDEWRIKTAKEFEDGLTDWMESVKSSEATRSATIERMSEESKDVEPLVKKKKKITNNMRTTVRQMVNLKSKQSMQEETAVMKLTNIAAAKGPRQSPVASAVRLGLGLLACLIVVGAGLYAAFVKPQETKAIFVSASEGVAEVIGPKRNKEADVIAIAPISVPPVSNEPSAAKTVVQNAADSMEKPATKLPPFDPNLLHDLYREDFQSNNNQTKRAFRIEYREFNPAWIKK